MDNQVDIHSYDVRTEDGKLYRKNRRHLCQSKEPLIQTAESSSVRSPQDNQANTSPATAQPIRPQLTGHQPVQDNFAGQPKQTEPMTVSPSQVPPSSPVESTVLTRSGQVSRARQHFKDFLRLNKDLRGFIVIEQSSSQGNSNTVGSQ